MLYLARIVLRGRGCFCRMRCGVVMAREMPHQVLTAVMPGRFKIARDHEDSRTPERPQWREIAHRNQREKAQQHDANKRCQAPESGLLRVQSRPAILVVRPV